MSINQNLEELTQSFQRHGLHNTLHIPRWTCKVCRGALSHTKHWTCDRCRLTYTSGTADRVGSLIYGCNGLRSGSLMHSYKDSRGSFDDRQFVMVLTALALRHRGCLDTLARKPVQHWAAVPSLKTIGAEHPFRSILAALQDTDCEIKVAASAAARDTSDNQRRALNPGLYEIRTPVPRGSHIIVVDDTWTTGGHAQSVAKALKQAGAGEVSILAIARWLDMRGRSRRVYDYHIRENPYAPHVCPWTGQQCPPATTTEPLPSRGPTREAAVPFPGFSWDAPGRIAPACRVINAILSDGGWHSAENIAARVAEEHGLKPETVRKLLQGMVKTGGLQRRGASGRGKNDVGMREVRLA